MTATLEKPRSSAREPEPRVVTEDVAKILARLVKPDDQDNGQSVSLIAEKANCSTRTVYRVLAKSSSTINLDLADRLCVAGEGHIAECRLVNSRGESVE